MQNTSSRHHTIHHCINNVYGFAPKLDVDRYSNAAGDISDYVIGVRELDQSNLTGNLSNWINKYTAYTHGYGFVAAAAWQPARTRPSHACC